MTWLPSVVGPTVHGAELVGGMLFGPAGAEQVVVTKVTGSVPLDATPRTGVGAK